MIQAVRYAFYSRALFIILQTPIEVSCTIFGKSFFISIVVFYIDPPKGLRSGKVRGKVRSQYRVRSPSLVHVTGLKALCSVGWVPLAVREQQAEGAMDCFTSQSPACSGKRSSVGRTCLESTCTSLQTVLCSSSCRAGMRYLACFHQCDHLRIAFAFWASKWSDEGGWIEQRAELLCLNSKHLLVSPVNLCCCGPAVPGYWSTEALLDLGRSSFCSPAGRSCCCVPALGSALGRASCS